MAIADDKAPSDNKVWGLFKLPFRNSGNPPLTTSSSASSHQNHAFQGQGGTPVDGSSVHSGSSSVSSVARSLLPTRRRLRLDPANKLYFPYEPENNEKPMDQKSKLKFKIMSLKVKGAMEYVPELFECKRIGDETGEVEILSVGTAWWVRPALQTPDCRLPLLLCYETYSPHPINRFPLPRKFCYLLMEYMFEMPLLNMYYLTQFDEQKDQVAVEQILRVVFLDVERPTPALEKLKRQLAEAEAALEARKKPPEDTGPKIIGEGLVIDEWKERRERYLARQQVEGVDSL
ncbi:hypothetical protein RJ639_009837 [Escallonia herrerae]|uniref:Uncharacterized protein n=1 Tax=Escallonia herrerae TaxID=1293975 RepID=A0AA88VUU4_9ASTE|nr:hypothetical protein RJ639_009837 [Escallonia herrerae]